MAITGKLLSNGKDEKYPLIHTSGSCLPIPKKDLTEGVNSKE